MTTHESLLVDVSARQIRAFITVATTLSYAEAAERLHYTEPGVYAQVKRFERVLGCRLFERHGRGIRLTPEGIALLPPCRAALADIEQIEQVRTRFAHSRRVVLAAGPVTGSYLLPALIRDFAEEQPTIGVDLLTGPTQEVMELVASGSADLGFCGSLDQLPLPGRLRLSLWLEEPFSLYASGPGPSALVAPVVIYTIGHALGPVSRIRTRLEESGIVDCETRFLPSADAVKGACMAGLGYALLPCRATILERRAGALSDVAGFAGTVSGQVWLCQPERPSANPDVRTFLNFLRKNSKRLVGLSA